MPSTAPNPNQPAFLTRSRITDLDSCCRQLRSDERPAPSTTGFAVSIRPNLRTCRCRSVTNCDRGAPKTTNIRHRAPAHVSRRQRKRYETGLVCYKRCCYNRFASDSRQIDEPAQVFKPAGASGGVTFYSGQSAAKVEPHLGRALDGEFPRAQKILRDITRGRHRPAAQCGSRCDATAHARRERQSTERKIAFAVRMPLAESQERMPGHLGRFREPHER